MKNYTHVIFDLDRTLWDFDRVSHEVLGELYLELLQPHTTFSFDYFHEHYKVINSGLWEMYRRHEIEKELLRVKRFTLALEVIGLDRPWIANELADKYVQKTAERAYLFPGTIELLDYLKSEGYVISVMTNGFKEVQYPKIARSGLGHYFEYLFISEEIGYNKPDIRIFEFALKKMNAKPEKVVFVGDDYEVDIEGAAAAGMDQVFFNPHTEPSEGGKPATYRISELKELMKIL
ncbi:Pyrimidine 5'-nucleotidase YjjG [bioreactor metagenome]|uniref:Pyrimidine 5'-nucleotidase YjjG n=1 Tax=bioreactor metagenome TaxID=1076179 RepID=A0A644WGC4_9ZZZZ